MSTPDFGQLRPLVNALQIAKMVRKQAYAKYAASLECSDIMAVIQERRRLTETLQEKLYRLEVTKAHIRGIGKTGSPQRRKKLRQAKRLRVTISFIQDCISQLDIGELTHVRRAMTEVRWADARYFELRDEVFAAFDAALGGDPSYKTELMLMAEVPDEYSVADTQYYLAEYSEHTEVHLHYGGEGSPGGRGDGHRQLHLYFDGTHELVYAREPALRD